MVKILKEMNQIKEDLRREFKLHYDKMNREQKQKTLKDFKSRLIKPAIKE